MRKQLNSRFIITKCGL